MKRRADNSSKGVYIYRPANAKPNKPQNERPSKQRKVESDGQEKQEKKAQGTPFVPLLNGEESASSVDLRYNAYQRLWSKQEAKIQVRGRLSWFKACGRMSDRDSGSIGGCRLQNTRGSVEFRQRVLGSGVSLRSLRDSLKWMLTTTLAMTAAYPPHW